MAKPKSIITPTIVSTTSVEEQPKNNTLVTEHIKDTDIHVDQNLRDSINYTRTSIDSHADDTDIHVSAKEKDTWNSKESQQGAQAKANKVMNSLQNHMNDNTVHLTSAEKQTLKDKYTKSETRNLLKHTLTGLEFLKSVFNRTELNTKYPNPKFNSCVYLRESKTSVIFNGKEWVDFNLIFNPEATADFDGFMTSEDKIKLDTIEEYANNYIHPDDVDTRHVSDVQINYWNNKADNVLASIIANGLMTSEDKIKLDTIENGANNYQHPDQHDPSIIKQDKDNRFVTDEDKSNWNNKVDHDYMDETINTTLSTVKSMIDTKVANIFNSSEDQLEVLRSLAFELKNNDVVKEFIDKYNECIKTKEFNEHVLNDRIHLNRNDIALLENVKSLLESGIPEIKIPESLPANGGNANTIANHGLDDLLNNRNFYEYTIGDLSYDIRNASIATNDADTIEEILSKSHTVLFKPGEYEINKEIVLKVSNAVIRGIGDASKLIGATFKIIGNNNVIENLTFTNKKYIDRAAIIIEGDNNIIKNNIISYYDSGITVTGKNNKITENTFDCIRRSAINLYALDYNAQSNYINKSYISYSGTGITLLSSVNKIYQNHITENNIIGCNTGIVLSNDISDITKTTMNFICQNYICRGNGDVSDYLPGHNTIISEFSSKNIISENITMGKQIHAPNDTVSQNIF